MGAAAACGAGGPLRRLLARAGQLACTAACLVLLPFSPAAADLQPAGGDTPGFERDEALAVSQAALGRTVDNRRLIRADGSTVALDDYRGKPLVVSLVFTSCAHICPATTRHLYRAVAEARQALGHDSFRIITVGFDTRRDTPEVMADFARRQGVQMAGWEFLATDEASIRGLTADLGFLYYPSGGGFDHLIQSSVIDRNGVVYRQIYGIDFRIPLLVEPLKELVFETRSDQSLLESLGNRVRLFCTVYDPASDSYRFSYAIFIGLAMGLALGTLAVLAVIREWLLHRAALSP